MSESAQAEDSAKDTKMEYPELAEDHAMVSADGRIEMDQEEVDAIIRNKRKVRDPKACYACHRRKVKCDRNLPCDSCVKRDHPELCSYERPTKKKRLALGHVMNQGVSGSPGDGQDLPLNSGPNISVPKEQWERINDELQKLRSAVHGVQQNSANGAQSDGEDPPSLSRSDFGTEREGIHAPSNQMGTMHLGSRSVLAYMMGTKSKSSQDMARVLLEENILPNLGLDNETATYPFVDLWSTESSIQDVSGLLRALPADEQLLEFWYAYRDVACTLYPVIPDKEAFENTIKYVLRQRTDHNRHEVEMSIDMDKPYGVSMPWLALLFSVLASGAQSVDRPAKERELTSQVFICCAYQALRMANFLSNACLETIQACLIIGTALAYNMNPGVAYIFLGMTLRSGLSMGLHVKSQNFSEEENYLRGRIWWALAWQDSHYSVSYDRPSSSILCFPEIPYTSHSKPGERSYVEAMSAIIRITQQILRDRTLNPQKAMTWNTIQKYKDEVDRIIADATPRLRERSLCSTVPEHLERLAFKLHSAYMISEICRPALKEQPSSQTITRQSSATPPISSPKNRRRKSSLSDHSAPSISLHAEIPAPAHLRAGCVANLERVVAAYVELHEISRFASRSWIGIQRTVSAAFLLGIIPETRQEGRVVHLLAHLEKVIAQRAAEDDVFDLSAENVNSPAAQTSKRVAVVNDSSRPGMSESPNWARSMTKSLNALGKLNAALAGSNQQLPSMQTNLTSSWSSTSAMYPQSSEQSQASKGIYVTPVVSPATSNSSIHPTPNNPSTSIPTSRNHFPIPSSSALTPQSRLHNHHTAKHHSSVKRDLYSPISSISNGPGFLNGGTNLGMDSMTPDSGTLSANSGGDWNYGNMTARALEYIQPGIWG